MIAATVLPAAYLAFRAPVEEQGWVADLRAAALAEDTKAVVARYTRGREQDRVLSIGAVMLWLMSPGVLTFAVYSGLCVWLAERARSRFSWVRAKLDLQ